MSEEIKEILDEIGYYQHIHENLTLSPKELDILKDYITNLQEENEELFKRFSNKIEEVSNLIKENKRLKEDIETLISDNNDSFWYEEENM